MRGVLDTEKLWNQEKGAIEQEVAQDLSDPNISFTRRSWRTCSKEHLCPYPLGASPLRQNDGAMSSSSTTPGMGIGCSFEQVRQDLRVKEIFGSERSCATSCSMAPFSWFHSFSCRGHPASGWPRCAGRVRDLLRGQSEILGHRLLGVSIEHAAQGGNHICQLISRKARASAEHHVFLRMGHARKPFGASLDPTR